MINERAWRQVRDKNSCLLLVLAKHIDEFNLISMINNSRCTRMRTKAQESWRVGAVGFNERDGLSFLSKEDRAESSAKIIVRRPSR